MRAACLGLAFLFAIGCAGDDPDPIVSYVNPPVGDIDGGYTVAVETQGFQDDFTVHLPEVTFGADPALSVTALSRSLIDVVVPFSGVPRVVDVTVRSTRKRQSAIRVDGFRYEIPASVVTVIPGTGDPAGGDVVEVQTAGFRDDFRMDTPLVTFAGLVAPVLAATAPDAIEVETPPGPPGVPVDVTVRSIRDVQEATLPDGYYYMPIPPPTRYVEMFGETLPLPSGSVVYCLDRGGSMAWSAGTWVDRFGNTVTGTRWDRVADETLRSIGLLDDSVLFNIYTFACDRESWSPGMVPATAVHEADAEAYLLGIGPYGGTGIGPAGAAALRGEPTNRTLFLVSDGQPNCGATGTAGHKALILGANVQSAEIHTVGIADSGVFRDFMRELAQETGGMYIHVQ